MTTEKEIEDYLESDEAKAMVAQVQMGVKIALSTMKMVADTMKATEFCDGVAEVNKAMYDAHTKQGFAPEQALQLISTMNIMQGMAGMSK